jgi:hypothetical protein
LPTRNESRRLLVSVAVCDPDAFYPLRNLVAGPLTKLSDLTEAERFVRTVVLHDEISMDLDPVPYDSGSDEWTEEEERAGRRNVLVALGPVLTGYDFFTERLGPGQPVTPDITLSPPLIDAARTFSNAEDGNPYYKAHVDFLKRIVGTVQKGGSALLASEFGSVALDSASTYPARLFESLDGDWRQLARAVDTGEGVVIPPVLSIVLTRCARRDAIPVVLGDLRDEWEGGRRKIWALLDQLKTADTVADAQKIRRELMAASRQMSPAQDEEIETRPLRVLWDLIAGSAAGAATAVLSGGQVGVGAVVGALGTASRALPPLLSELGPALFARGAFDLARRVRREVKRAEYGALARLLTDAEKNKLGL